MIAEFGDRAVADSFAEHDARNAPLQPGHLRQHDIGSAASREVVQPLESLSAEPVVMIAEEHVLALSRIQADVAWLAGPTCVRLVNDANVRVCRSKLVQTRRSLVG